MFATASKVPSPAGIPGWATTHPKGRWYTAWSTIGYEAAMRAPGWHWKLKKTRLRSQRGQMSCRSVTQRAWRTLGQHPQRIRPAQTYDPYSESWSRPRYPRLRCPSPGMAEKVDNNKKMGYTTAGEGALWSSLKDVQHSRGFVRGSIATQHTSSSVTTILGRRMGLSAKAQSVLHIAECGPSPGERFKVLRCRLLAADGAGGWSFPPPPGWFSWFLVASFVTREKIGLTDASTTASPADHLSSARGDPKILRSITKYNRHNAPTLRYVDCGAFCKLMNTVQNYCSCPHLDIIYPNFGAPHALWRIGLFGIYIPLHCGSGDVASTCLVAQPSLQHDSS